MVNYQLGKIYKIVDNTNGNIYIGSTCEERLCTRFQHHKSHYKSYLEGKAKYIASFEILKNNDYDIILIENVQCENRDQLLTRERHHIDSNVCINKNRPKLSKDEKRIAHRKYKVRDKQYRDEHKPYFKNYYQQNKERLTAMNKQYREKIKAIKQKHREEKKQLKPNKPKKVRIIEDTKSYMQKYYQKNKQKMNTHSNNYMNDNKELMILKRKYIYALNKRLKKTEESYNEVVKLFNELV
jgi:hypothetical protein